MYEIWLGLNIFWEILLANLAFAGVYLALLIILHAMALGRSATVWRRSLSLGTAVAGLLAIIAAMVLPGATDSSWSNVYLLLDYAALAGMAIAAGIAGGLLAWPLIALLRGRSANTGA